MEKERQNMDSTRNMSYRFGFVFEFWHWLITVFSN